MVHTHTDTHTLGLCEQNSFHQNYFFSQSDDKGKLENLLFLFLFFFVGLLNQARTFLLKRRKKQVGHVELFWYYRFR